MNIVAGLLAAVAAIPPNGAIQGTPARYHDVIWTGRPRPRRPVQMRFISAKDHAIDCAVRRTAKKLAAGSRHGVSRKKVRENLARIQKQKQS